MNIGKKIKELRIKSGLTQEDLANRCELSKGFISQLERDLTSPSITTLIDILECLGTNIKDFFNDEADEKVVFKKEDMFKKQDEDLKNSIIWVIPSAQKNSMEPILITLDEEGTSKIDPPHQGEEFGYVLSGSIVLFLGSKKYRLKKGECFYFKPNSTHYIKNNSKTKAQILWISCPPSF